MTEAIRLPRGICPDCHTERPLKGDGTIRRHDCTPVARDTITIALPWCTPPLAQNDRQHWATKARAFGQAKNEARWAIRAARIEPIVGAEVTLHYRVPDRRVRDADGPAPTLKAVLDALVAEKVLPADDWVCVPACGIRIHEPVKGMPGSLWIELTDITHYEPGVTA